MTKAATQISRTLTAVAAATLIGCGGGATTSTDLNVVQPSEPVNDWELVWSDEFDGSSIDSNKWTHEVNCDGGGNNEAQCYTADSANSFVADGYLNIVALPAEQGAEKPYTSARMTTQYKGDFKYGRIEMRAKLPSGQGSWPAFWMMPTDAVYGGWPRSGEIDIVEAVNLKAADAEGNPEAHVYGTIHYGSGPAEGERLSSGQPYLLPDGQNPADDFHTYAIEWQEGEIRWYVDGYLYATQRRSEVRYNRDNEPTGLRHKGWYTEYFNQATGELEKHWDNAPFDQEFYLILNQAVGGNWPEAVNETGIDAEAFANGQTFQIDYVRVFQCALDPETGKGCETLRPGYDSLEDALVEGAAPIPAAPSNGEPDPVTMLFDDALATDLTLDSYNPDGAVALDQVEEAGRGMVLEMVKSGAVGNFFFTADQPYDLTAYGTRGELVFDVKITSADAGVDLYVKFDSGWPNVSDMIVDVDADGQWHTVRINMAELLARENTFAPGNQADPSSVANIFVAEATGVMTAYFDNVRLEYPAGGSTTTFFDDALASDLIIDSYNPDGVVSYDIVAEPDRGNVLSVNKAGATGNLFFTADVPYDFTQFGEGAELVFDLQVSSLDGGAELLVKLDSGWPNVSDTSVTLPATGEWATIRLNLADLLAQENRYSPGSYADPTSVVNVFVVEPTAAMAFKLDNVRIEVPAPAQVSMLYDDMLAAGLIFNSYNPDGAVSIAEIAETDRGSVIELTKTGAVGNFYFESDVPYDLSDWGAQSEIVFDVYLESADAGVELYVKLDSGWPNVSDTTITLPEAGSWTEIRINIADLLARENSFSPGSYADPLNITNIFVVEPTGPMVIRFDNVRLEKR